jgi:hypothetical protein
MKERASRVNRVGFFGAGLAVAMLIAAGIWHVNAPEGVAQSTGGFDGAIFEVVPDTPTSSLPASGPFYRQGKIYENRTLNADGTVPATAEQVGTWRSWGHIVDSSTAVVNQSLQLDAFNGVIELQGPLGPVTLAIEGGLGLSVVGGLGTFRGASGQASIEQIGSGESFRVVLQEDSRRRKGRSDSEAPLKR